jgi:hypothetical protein
MKDFVPYEETLALRGLGFDEPCFGWWFADEKMLIVEKSTKSTSENIVQAPTFSQAFRWFREKYDLASHIATYWQHDWNNYSYQYYFVEDKIEWNGIEHYKTYEEAELACLRKLISLAQASQ